MTVGRYNSPSLTLAQQLAVLREKWPLAFPVQHQGVRPLAMGVARQVAAAMGWSLPYTFGVLGRWKMAEVYCQAVLCHDQRIALDGAPAEMVDAEAKDLAAKQLGGRSGAAGARHGTIWLWPSCARNVGVQRREPVLSDVTN